MKREHLEYRHREQLSPLLDQISTPLSEYCFANLYFFRDTHHYEVLDCHGCQAIAGISYDQKSYLMPLHDLTRTPGYLDQLLQLGRELNVHMIFPIPEDWLQAVAPYGLNTVFTEDDSDYRYATEKLQHYPGRKLHCKRNLLKQHETLYTPHFELLNPHNLDVALTLVDEWQETAQHTAETSDYDQCREALSLSQDLNLEGAIFYADAQPSGLLLGKPVCPETFTIHFAKGNVRYKGIYPYMFNRFAQQVCPQYAEINLEQDMGIAGLRKNKRSYVPDTMGRKYRVVLSP